jgi:hypothetical protein
VGLPRISFREVVCSEKVNPDNKLETCITMFAVSNHNDLYYIEGSRKWKVDGSISLASSGLPIRQNVSRVSCQYNAAMNSSELIYTGTGANEIKHLLRDPHTTCWSESSISFAAPKILNKYHAYVTTISLRCTDGGNVGKDFPVKIKSESMIVLVNDRSYALSTSAREVRTDVQGQLVVVSQASASLEATEDLNLRAPTYTIEIFREGISHTADIHAGQRVIEGFSNMQSAEKLANARSTTGEAIFENGALQNRQEDFEQSASLLKELPSMLNKVSSQPSDQPSASPSELGKEVILGSKQHSTAERSTAVHLSNMQSEENSVSKFVGDALEWIKGAVKKAFKVAFKIVLGGIKLLLTIAGKVISFVVDAVGPLIHAVGTFLKDKLGLDFGKLFKMLGLIFDPEKTKQNQDVSSQYLKRLSEGETNTDSKIDIEKDDQNSSDIARGIGQIEQPEPERFLRSHRSRSQTLLGRQHQIAKLRGPEVDAQKFSSCLAFRQSGREDLKQAQPARHNSGSLYGRIQCVGTW